MSRQKRTTNLTVSLESSVSKPTPGRVRRKSGHGSRSEGRYEVGHDPIFLTALPDDVRSIKQQVVKTTSPRVTFDFTGLKAPSVVVGRTNRKI